MLEPFAPTLITVVNDGASASLRLNAIGALSGTHFEAISNSLAQLLQHTNSGVRSKAVALLELFPGDFAEQALHICAGDNSPKVRAAVADVIGNGKLENLLPVLAKLFDDPVGHEKPVGHLSLDEQKAGGHIVGTDGGTTIVDDPNYPGVNIGDVHASAGFALLKFDVELAGEILKTHVSDKGFCLSFIRKLAPNGEALYFPILAQELKVHTANSEQEAVKNGFHWGLSYWLSGNYGWAWDTLFAYVSAETRETLADPKMASILDALQIADDPGEARTRSLYEFFLANELIERAKELRRGIIRRTEDKAIDKKSFGFPEKLKLFDEMDEKHSLKPGLGL